MNYLIDSNSLLTPYKKYYWMDLFPSYWNKLSDISETSLVICDHVKNEIIINDEDHKKDSMELWLEQKFLGEYLSEYTQEVVEIWQQVMEYIYQSPVYNDRAFENWSQESVADPWLIAVAKVHDLPIVSLEVRNKNLNPINPSKNAKLPDVCDEFGVRYLTLQEMLVEVGFRL